MGRLERIVTDPTIYGSNPIVRGMRISVATVLSLLAQEETQGAMWEDCPGLESADIRARLAFAAHGGHSLFGT